MRPLFRIVCCGLLAAAIWFAPPAASTRAETPGTDLAKEYKVKAAYLYNFGRYVKWPSVAFARENSPFVIGIMGDDPFDIALKKLAARKTLNGREIRVVQFETPDQYQPCHILFISGADNRAVWEATRRQVQGQSVLIVGESDGFANRGGCVNFFIAVNGDKKTVGFEINVDAVNKRSLRADAKFLKLGALVRE